MRAALEEALDGGGLESYRRVVEVLAEEHDVLDVAAAAVKLADAARDGAADEEEIPAVAAPPPPRPLPAARPFAPRPGAPQRADSPDVARIYIGLGRSAGVRPADLVGAIANEARIPSREIGAIEIADRFSLVEVPAAAVNGIISALRTTTIRGKPAKARRDRMPKR